MGLFRHPQWWYWEELRTQPYGWRWPPPRPHPQRSQNESSNNKWYDGDSHTWKDSPLIKWHPYKHAVMCQKQAFISPMRAASGRDGPALAQQGKLRDLIAATGLGILLKLDSNRRFFSPCNLEIWWMTPKNNRAPLLYYIKLCASFCSHWWIQTGVTVRKCPIEVKFDNF